MSPIGLVIAFTAIGVVGALLAISGWMQPAPSLQRVVQHLQRPGIVDGAGRRPSGPNVPTGRIVPKLVASVRSKPSLLPSDAELLLGGRSIEQHVVYLVVGAVGGLIGPLLFIGVLQSAGVISLSWFVPLLAALGCGLLVPFIVHTTLVERAQTVRADMRYQVSAYLDVVTMLLAGNTGYEGALEQAAHPGDGRLFAELRRRIRESGARGASLTEALQRTGRDLGLDELEQIAATAALSAAEGAPVARTLAAKCATLRGALSTEQESEARLRTSRLTTPIVGMALIFMGLVIYPALSFS